MTSTQIRLSADIDGTAGIYWTWPDDGIKVEAMLPHVDVPIVRESDVNEARAAVAKIAFFHGIDETTKGRVALVATELATNLLKHATDGRLLIGCHAIDDGAQIEVIAIDSGPGMREASRNMRDSRHSESSSGRGLGEVRHLSTDFSIFSMVGKGTVVVSRAWSPAAHAPNAKSPSARFSHAGICLAAPGQVMSSDAWAIRIGDGEASVIVSDGSGEYPAAAHASAVATNSFQELDAEPRVLLQRAHQLLEGTVGAAVAIARLDARSGSLVFSGDRRVTCKLVSSNGQVSVSPGPGVLGNEASAIQEARLSWPAHSVVVLHSNGLDRDWNLSSLPGLLRCDPAVIAGWLLRDHVRKDAVAIVVMKRS